MRRRSTPAAASRLVVATGNPGKLRELRALLAGLPFAVVGLREFGILAPEETGTTLLANALLKARHAAAATGLAVVADDSGLEVDALGGAPGVYSARYAGPDADDAANNAKLIAALAGLPPAKRGARYRCVLAYLPALPGAAPVIAEAVWRGSIVAEPRGAGGFGYDPLFLPSACSKTAAELDPEVKNRVSHRGVALRRLRERLERDAAGGA
ncbi:MAG TPA: RdgB/HAM1 family non-canonical purine NTP pyrophosphatase [Steroidobacteraceae bacterium]|nr:RdgB/HAM1 family non-canonical purine NTP pyrophosphatase [Steroidobacteraceae bacterium]